MPSPALCLLPSARPLLTLPSLQHATARPLTFCHTPAPRRALPCPPPLQQALHAFVHDPRCAVLTVVMSTSGGAAGLTLTVASTAFIMEPSLNPGLEAQAAARIYRLGAWGGAVGLASIPWGVALALGPLLKGSPY